MHTINSQHLAKNQQFLIKKVHLLNFLFWLKSFTALPSDFLNSDTETIILMIMIGL